MLEAELFYRNGFSSNVYFSLFLDVLLVFNVILIINLFLYKNLNCS